MPDCDGVRVCDGRDDHVRCMRTGRRESGKETGMPHAMRSMGRGRARQMGWCRFALSSDSSDFFGGEHGQEMRMNRLWMSEIASWE